MTCAYCGKEFETKYSFKKYCSDECRKRQEKELEKKNKGKKTKYEKECEECHKKFLTRGCPRGCGFCIVAEKEGRKSVQVAAKTPYKSITPITNAYCIIDTLLGGGEK